MKKVNTKELQETVEVVSSVIHNVITNSLVEEENSSKYCRVEKRCP